MKVMSTIMGAVLFSQMALLPVSAESSSYSSTTSTTTTTTTQPAVVEGAAPCPTACPAVITETACPATVITQPAVVSRICERKNLWPLGLLAVAGIATAIAVPIATHHHHHNNRARDAAIRQQQLLLFAYHPL